MSARVGLVGADSHVCSIVTDVFVGEGVCANECARVAGS